MRQTMFKLKTMRLCKYSVVNSYNNIYDLYFETMFLLNTSYLYLTLLTLDGNNDGDDNDDDD